MSSSYKKLSANISLFAISSSGTKIIGFLLTPLYTSVLSTREFGTADLLFTLLQLAIPIFSIDIADGVMRFVLDKDYDDASVLDIGIKVTLLGSAILFLVIFLVKRLNFFDYSNSYYLFIFFSFTFSSIYNILVNYLKGKEKIKDMLVAGILSSALNAGCNILFLLKFDLGIEGYLLAYLISVLLSALYLFIKTWRYGYLASIGLYLDMKLMRQMLLYSAPLILNGLAWWINNSLDKFFVTFFCGVAANGLLAVAYKIPSIISMLQTIFNQAWSLSAIQEFDPNDSDGFMGKVYSFYGCALVISCSLLLVMNIPLAKILYSKDFFVAWQYTGTLIIAQLFGGLSVCISGAFNAVKDTKTLATTTLIGAGVNVAMNAILIPGLGVLGATIATVISNIVMWACRLHKVRTYIDIKVNYKRDVVAYIFLIIQCAIGLLIHSWYVYIAQTIIIVLIFVLYRRELKTVAKRMLGIVWSLAKR